MFRDHGRGTTPALSYTRRFERSKPRRGEGRWHGCTASRTGSASWGNSSAICDIVNIKIKFREPFRPFAPSILAEKARVVDLGDAAKQSPSRFMLYVAPVLGDRVPAVTHADGSTQPQLVHRDTNARDYRLIERFGEATDVPVLSNTSFNLKGEPIVSAPSDALDTFRRSGMDLLVLEHHLVRTAR